MAHPSAPTWNTIASKELASTTTSCNLKILIFSTIPNPHHKRTHVTSFSFDPSSSSCSTSHTATLTHITNNKNSLQHAKNHDENDGFFTPGKKDKKFQIETISKIGSQSNVKKRPLWRRFLFASNKFRSIILLNLITVVYASDIPVVKAVEAIMDPAAFSAVRFIMSAIPFLPFVIRARDDVQTRNSGIELGLWISLAYFVEAIGLLTSDAGRASFLSLFTVIVVPLLDGMFGAIIPAHTWFGVFMSVLGVAVLECSGSPPNVGDLLNFLSAIFYGIHMLRTEHISRSTKRENFLPLLGYEVSVVALLSTIWFLIGGWFDGVNNFDQPSWTWTLLWEWLVAFPWIPAFYSGVFSTGLCLWIEIAAMRDVSATETAIIYGLEPLWGAGFAWFLLGERWGTTGWIGAALVLGGSLIVQIVGSSSSNKSIEAEEGDHKGDFLMVSDKQKLQRSLSTSPVVVRSRNDVVDMLK